MFKGYKVNVLIFAGRKETMEILMPQIKSDYIDKIIIGVNTTNKEDLKYIYSLKDNFEKIVYEEIPPNIIHGSKRSYNYFYSKMEDPNTIYFKLDDDLIYIEPGFFEKMLEFRCNHPEYICIYPMIINNPLCNYLLNIPFPYPKISIGEFMYNTWKDPTVAERLLNTFAEYKDADVWHIPNFEFGKEFNFYFGGGVSIRPSINAICFFGKDFANLHVKDYYNIVISDEEYLTNQIFECGRKSIVYGETLVVHYAFFSQRQYLNSKNILEKYK